MEQFRVQSIIRGLHISLTLSTLLTIKRAYHLHSVSISVTSPDIWLSNDSQILWISEQLKPAYNLWHHSRATNQSSVILLSCIYSTDRRLHPEPQTKDILTSCWLLKQRQHFHSHFFSTFNWRPGQRRKDSWLGIRRMTYTGFYSQRLWCSPPVTSQ